MAARPGSRAQGCQGWGGTSLELSEPKGSSGLNLLLAGGFLENKPIPTEF